MAASWASAFRSGHFAIGYFESLVAGRWRLLLRSFPLLQTDCPTPLCMGTVHTKTVLLGDALLVMRGVTRCGAIDHETIHHT